MKISMDFYQQKGKKNNLIFYRFLDKNVYFQTMPDELNLEELNVEPLVNFRDFVFTITPKLRSEFNTTYQEVQKEYKKLCRAFNLLEAGERKNKLNLLE